MSLTSFRSDPARVRKEMEISTYAGRYSLDTPGPGVDLPFMEDAQIRMQTWGANRHTNFVNVESDLKGMTRRLNRDVPAENNYREHGVASEPISTFRTQAPLVQESRASLPAWTFRDAEMNRWEHPLLNPQALAHLELGFHSQIDTRLLEKDAHWTPPR